MPLRQSQKGCVLASQGGGVEGGPKPQLPVLILIVISYTLLLRNQVVLLVDLSNMYLYPDNELIIMKLNHVEYVYTVIKSNTA